MTQDINRRKALTAYLGECWNDKDLDSYEKKIHISNRTFTTPDDFFALKDKLEERGDWSKFMGYAYPIFDKQRKDTPPKNHVRGVALDRFVSWLLNPTRFCELVAEWLGKQEGGKL